MAAVMGRSISVGRAPDFTVGMTLLSQNSWFPLLHLFGGSRVEVIILQHQDKSFPSQGQARHPSASFWDLGSMRVSPSSNPTFTSPELSPSYVLMDLFFSVPGCHPTTGSQEKPRPWGFLHEGN